MTGLFEKRWQENRKSLFITPLQGLVPVLCIIDWLRPSLRDIALSGLKNADSLSDFFLKEDYARKS
jgi:hypothetical protein